MNSAMFMVALGILQLGAAVMVLAEGKSFYLAGVYLMYSISNFLLIGVANK
jgi:hypothetical protein